MTDGLFHPSPEQLEAYAAGELDDGDTAVLESHLLDCGRCRVEAEEWRALFGALAELPRLEPSATFADNVMAAVRIRRPLMARVSALAGQLERLLPRSRRTWTLLGVAAVLPAAGMTALLLWVLSQPWLTINGLLSFGASELLTALTTLPADGLDLLRDSGVGVWLTGVIQRLATSGMAPLGVAAATFAALTAVSAWVLYKNLIRPGLRERTYASYSV